ncbi:MAG: DUF6316 family protein [Porticoccaceae bacterium]|nr:hypothetical protein [Pseudomonadales bacterium]MCP5172018.1 hypothetical protein [Pseudomonadales bacterium]
MDCRQNEEQKTRFRTERFQLINGKWYFSIRESFEPVGPFETKEEAKFEAEMAVRKMEEGDNPFGVQTRYSK